MADTGDARLDRYDFNSHYVQLPEGRIHYIDEGTGPVLLMLHGNPTWSYLYRHLIHGLKDRFRCIAPDHLGFGLSDKPRGGDYTVVAHVRRLGAFIEELGLKKLTPVVQDWGGPIGLSWAVAHKDRVERLVVMNTIGFPPDRSEVSRKQMPALLALASLRVPGWGEFLVKNLNGFVRLGVPGGIYNKDRKTKEILKGYLFPYPDRASREAILKFPREIPLSEKHPNWDFLKGIEQGLDGWDVPTLLVWALKDPAFGFAFAERFQKLLPNVKETVKIPNASHFLQEDAPEPIVEAVRRFMA